MTMKVLFLSFLAPLLSLTLILQQAESFSVMNQQQQSLLMGFQSKKKQQQRLSKPLFSLVMKDDSVLLDDNNDENKRDGAMAAADASKKELKAPNFAEVLTNAVLVILLTVTMLLFFNNTGGQQQPVEFGSLQSGQHYETRIITPATTGPKDTIVPRRAVDPMTMTTPKTTPSSSSNMEEWDASNSMIDASAGFFFY